jgi:transposase-like protein
MARYGKAFGDRIVARLLPPESAAIEVVSREMGVSVGTLERWRANLTVSISLEFRVHLAVLHQRPRSDTGPLKS